MKLAITTVDDFVLNSSNVVTVTALYLDEETLYSELLVLSEYATYIYLVLNVFGFVLNSYVLYRLIRQGCSNVDRFLIGSGMLLATMAFADLISLLLIFLTIIFSNHKSQSTRVIHCKVSMFLIHTMTGVSMWCWMVASGQRYWAVYHPFSSLNRSRLVVSRAILGVVVVSVVLNGWLLIAVDANDNRCTESDFVLGNDSINRSLHILEILWNFLTPALLTSFMDVRLFLLQPPEMVQGTTVNRNLLVNDHIRTESPVISQESLTRSMSLTLNPTGRRPREIRRSQGNVARNAVRHWLLITSVDLLLNAPDTTLRLLALIGLMCEDCIIPWTPTESRLTLSVVIIARLLYFAQFSFNAAFLTTLIYRHHNVQQRPFPTMAVSSSINNIRSRNNSTAF